MLQDSKTSVLLSQKLQPRQNQMKCDLLRKALPWEWSLFPNHQTSSLRVAIEPPRMSPWWIWRVNRLDSRDLKGTDWCIIGLLLCAFNKSAFFSAKADLYSAFSSERLILFYFLEIFSICNLSSNYLHLLYNRCSRESQRIEVRKYYYSHFTVYTSEPPAFSLSTMHEPQEDLKVISWKQ